MTFPLDVATAKAALWDDPAIKKELETDRKAFSDIEEQLRTLGQSNPKSLFPFHRAEKDCTSGRYVFPICHETEMDSRKHINPFHIPTSMDTDDDDPNGTPGVHLYVLALGDAGIMLVWPSARTDFIYGVAIFLNSDFAFVPLHSQADYAARRLRDLKHTEMLRQYVRDAVSKG